MEIQSRKLAITSDFANAFCSATTQALSASGINGAVCTVTDITPAQVWIEASLHVLFRLHLCFIYKCFALNTQFMCILQVHFNNIDLLHTV